MTVNSALIRRIARECGGATMVEFAMIATPLFMVLLGLMDFGYRSYVDSVVEGTVHKAARLATVGDLTSTQIDDYVRTQLSHFSNNGTVTIAKTNYYQFSNVGKPEKLTTDVNSNGVWDSGDCYEDSDNDGHWDTVAGKNGLGGSEDVVYYTVSLQYPRLIPLGGFFGWADIQTISATTLMRNQPYAVQAVPPIKCTSS